MAVKLAKPMIPKIDPAQAVLQTVAAGHAIPIFWVAAHEGKPLLPQNGTCFLLDGSIRPGLTGGPIGAAHVELDRSIVYLKSDW
jgi:hypothetical protein